MKSLAPLLAFLSLLSPPGATFPLHGGAPYRGPLQDPLDAPLTVRGQLVDPDGKPLAGVHVLVSGWVANQELVREHGLPEAWEDPVPDPTDEEGRFEFTFAPPRAYQFTVDVDTRGFGHIGWRWSTQQMPGSSELDLGRTVLEPPGVIEGHLEDERGTLLAEGWRVTASLQTTFERHRRRVYAHAEVDPDSGTFRIEELPPGTVELSASDRSGSRIDTQVVTTTSDEVTRQVLVLRGPDPARRLFVRASASPFFMFRLEGARVHAISAEGHEIPLVPVPGRVNEWHAVDVDPGLYAIVIEEPLFLPWRRTDVSPGSPVHARLEGAAALDLRVLDPEGRPVTRAGLEIRYENANFFPDTVTLVEDGGLLPGDGRLSGIVPGTWHLLVTPEGLPSRRVRLADLAAGETREVRIRLERPGRISGRVLGPDGGPRAGVRVQRTEGERPGHDGPPGRVRNISVTQGGTLQRVPVRYREEEVTSDAEGRFTFEGVAPGPHAVRALDGPWVTVDEVVQVQGGETLELDLALPGTGSVRATVLLPEDADAGQTRVRAEPAGIPLGRTDPSRPSRVHLDASTPRTFEHLPVGEVRVHVLLALTHGGHTRSRDIASTHVRVEADATTEVTLDLRESFPVMGRLRITREGRVDPNLHVSLLPVPPADGEPDPSSRVAVGGPLDEDGWCFVGASGPGDHHVRVMSLDECWSWHSPEPVRVEARTPFTREVDVPIVHRTLRVRGALGAPVADQSLYWCQVGMNGSLPEARTDAEGRLELHVPPGEYGLVRTEDGRPPRVIPGGDPLEGAPTFTIVAGDGEIEVVLPD